MAERERLQHEYMQRVCSALTAYVEHGSALRVRSEPCSSGSGLEVTFTLEDLEAFHAFLEQREPPQPSKKRP